jgi:D-alanyl-lipoteichoic acid acyltransferase DltB (MBOAT superfamily)
VAAAIVLLLALTRHLDPALRLTATRPPTLLAAALALVVLAVLSALTLAVRSRRMLIAAASLFLIAIFIVLKSEPLAAGASALIRTQTGQQPELAGPLDIRWLGFSYIAFRLLHTLRDRLAGRLPSLALREYLIYILFFPALTAGPIDRAERFAGDLRSTSPALAAGGARLAIGVFKKFVLADSLALFSLAPDNVRQATSPLWLWILLYAYAFRLYLDFSGYTDVAIGLGRLFGIRLPENFSRPYLRENLTAFWNSWHMTLAGWFRSYFFNPLTRALRGARRPLPAALIILLGQMSTMILIGLWHGITWNFAVWGAWHGAGLFLHNRWSDLLKTRGVRPSPGQARFLAVAGTLLTFHFVTLGWAWFALPSLDLSAQMLLGLFGAPR